MRPHQHPAYASETSQGRARLILCGSQKFVLNEQVQKGKDLLRCTKLFYNPVPPNCRVCDPMKMEELRHDLLAADSDAQQRDKNGTVEKYGSSTFLTALETSSEESDLEQEDCGSDTLDSEHGGEQVAATGVSASCLTPRETSGATAEPAKGGESATGVSS